MSINTKFDLYKLRFWQGIVREIPTWDTETYFAYTEYIHRSILSSQYQYQANNEKEVNYCE